MRFAPLLGLVVAVASFAAPAGAGLLPGLQPCGNSTDHPFAAWGDPMSYTLVPGGSFESGAPGWSLSGGAAVVAGNEPYSVHGVGESHSLMLPAGSSAQTPAVCMNLFQPTLRLFARGSGGPLHVQVTFRGLLGVLAVLDGGSVPPSGVWQPSPPLSLLLTALNSPLGATSVQFRFTPAYGASFQIDDVYVDPWIVR